MAITLNTYSYRKQPVTIQITGATPADLKLVSCNISYGNSDVLEPVIDWKGTLSFFGAKSKFDQFGIVGFKTHKITVTYGTDKTFTGYLLPEVYTVPNTGFEEVFSINFESVLGQLDRMLWAQKTSLYSIQYILDYIQTNTGLTGITVKKSFSESLSSLYIYSANFTNDDNNNENYMKILRDICTTFGFKAVLLWTGVLSLTSCELMNGVDVYPLNNHLGINETYSVGQTLDTAAVHVSNYALPNIPANFELSGSEKVVDQKPMRIRRGKEFAWSRVGNFNQYFRQIYGFRPGQNEWHLNKYDSSGAPVDEFDATKYLPGYVAGQPPGYNDRKGLVPVMGAYPVAWNRVPDGGNSSGFEESIWWKLYPPVLGGQAVTNARANLMSLKLENWLSAPNSYFTFDFQVMWTGIMGDVNNYDAGWYSNYDADNNATFSSNMDEGLVQIDPAIRTGPTSIFRIKALIKFTHLDGTEQYWVIRSNQTPKWETGLTGNNRISYINTTGAKEFEFASIEQGFIMPIVDADGKKPLFLEDPGSGCWVRFPAERGTLEISFGAEEAFIAPNILFRNLKFKVIQGHSDSSSINLSQTDVLYSNTLQSDVDHSDTFYMYSDNKFSGRGQLFTDIAAKNRLDELNFQSSKEKPEWHRIRLITKWASNAREYKDILNIDDVKPAWADRFFNGGEFSLTDGTATVQLIEAKQNIGGEI